MKEISTGGFDSVLNAPKAVVDFWASWCGPCKALEPTLKVLDEKYKDIMFVKVNVEKENTLASRYAVTALPAIFLLKEGKVMHSLVGAVSEEKIRLAVEEYLL